MPNRIVSHDQRLDTDENLIKKANAEIGHLQQKRSTINFEMVRLAVALYAQWNKEFHSKVGHQGILLIAFRDSCMKIFSYWLSYQNHERTNTMLGDR